VKICRRKARVIPTEAPAGKGILVNKEDLFDVSPSNGSPDLFEGLSGPTPETGEVEAASIVEAGPRPPKNLPALPFGLLDLDNAIATEPGPPLRVRCYVRDCPHWLRPPSRGFKGDVCPDHGIRCHLSGGAATYTYARSERNLIVARKLFKGKLRRNPHKFESWRFGFENSEDAVTWNVFRSLQEAHCLHEVARYITGLDLRDEPTLYLWGLRMSDNSLELWDLLQAARDHFETNRLPVKRPATEPDIGLHLPHRYLILIEAKLGSANSCYADGPRKNNQSLTKDELLDLYQHPQLQILDVEKARAAARVWYQLWRNLQFAAYMAMLEGPRTLAFHANLVRAGYEHESTQEFGQLIRADYQDRFTRITWENLYVLAGLRWRRLGRLQEYMLLKTVRLAPAFHLDIG
jgi:hypothetical protein